MIHQLIDLWFRGWRSLVEILLLSVAIYYGYLYFRGTRGAKVLTGLAIVFLTLTLISTLLNLVVIGWIVRSFSVFLAVALVVIFQPELRRGLAALGGHPIFSLTSEKRETVHDLAEAVMQLANKQFGALIAIVLKLFWVRAPKWLSAAIGLTLGWVGAVAFPQLLKLSPVAIALVDASGLLYTVGAVVYARRRPNPRPQVFGYHELFQVLTVAAVACEYVVVAFYVLPRA